MHRNMFPLWSEALGKRLRRDVEIVTRVVIDLANESNSFHFTVVRRKNKYPVHSEIYPPAQGVDFCRRAATAERT